MESELEAKDIYILMSKEYRISRNVRAEWYLKRINSRIKISRKRHIRDYNEELEVISVLPVDPPSEWDYDIAHEYSYLVTERSQLHFISRKYRLAFCLDLSPSLSSTSPDSENAFFDGIITMLQKCLRGIIKPFYIPGSQILFHPKVYVSVIAHIPFLRSFIQQVLVQGHLLVSEKESMQFFLEEVCSKAQQLLNEIAKVTLESYNLFIEKQQESSDVDFNNMDEGILQLAYKQHIMVSADIAFVKMLQHSILSLQLLPENSMAGIIILTDGVISLPNSTVFETLLVHLRSLTISCSFLQLSKNYKLHSGFGYVPFSDLMSFFANATYGVYFKELPYVKKNYENEMNNYHRAFLTWGFQKRSGDGKYSPMKTGSQLESSMIGQEAGFTVRKKEWSSQLNATLNAVLSCRIREGYIIKDISVAREQIQLVLVLPWKYCISIEYHIQAPFPITHCGIQNEIWIEASYEFLNDVSTDHCNPDLRSQYRRRMVAKYWSTLQELKKTDCILAGLQHFSSSSANYTIPDCFQKGHSVFHLNPETNMPENASKIQFPLFESYWKRVCLLDINKWQKWMHTHRIGLILEHDSPLPKNLHITNASARYGKIQSRQAELTLTTFLDDWTDFALFGNYSYVKILFGADDKEPTFIVVRVTTVKPPCLSVRLAFLGGTSGQLRNEVVKDFKSKVSALVLRGRTRSKENKKSPSNEKGCDGKKEVDELSNQSIPCCILMHKPIEKILIWYDRSPINPYLGFTSQKKLSPAYNSLDSVNNSAANNYNLLCRYLYHRRWIWNLQPTSCPPISTAAISRILNAITRLRLQEGFKFAYSKDGIVSMVKQYDLKVNFHEKIGKLRSHIEPNDLKGHCVVQYLIFPPKFNNTRVSIQEDSEESDGVEADGESQIITECWVEPQNGTILPQNLNYEQLANSFTPIDRDCIFTLATFECLVRLEQFNNGDESLADNWMASTVYNDSSWFPIEKICFAPRVTKLINRCQQTEILFSSLSQSCCSVLLPKFEDKLRRADVANGYLYSFFIQHLQKLHGTTSFSLSPDENNSLPKLLQNRLRKESQDHSPFTPGIEDDTIPSCNWRCFVKYISPNNFFMTIIPASYQDLKLLFLSEKNIREANTNCLQVLATADDLSQFDNGKAEIVNKITEYSETNALSDGETLHKLKSLQPIHSASLSLISPKLNYNQDGTKSGRQTVTHSPQLADVPARVRYKSGPAITSEGVAFVDSIQPMSRERASSLYSNKAKGARVVAPADVDVQKVGAAARPQPETGGRLRKRNASMPSKGCAELSRIKNVDPLKSGLLLGGNEIRGCNKKKIVEYDFPEYDDLILASAVLPVYVFDSNFKVISSQLLNRTNHNSVLGKDVHINSTFKNCSVSAEEPLKSCSQASFAKLDSLDSFSEESDAIGNPVKALQCHIEAIERCHHSGFVRGVFEALTRGFYVHSSDVLSALDQCRGMVEEISLTDFLKVICGHLKDFISRTTEVKKTVFTLEEKDKNMEADDKEDLFSLKLLKEHHPNRELIDIQRDIKQIFNEILLKRFKPVPNLPDYYYYSPSSSSFEDSRYHCKNCRSKTKKFSGCSNLTEEDDIISFVSRSEEVEAESDQRFYSHSGGVHDSNKSGSKSTDEEERCACEILPPEESELEVQPLFLHLTCTIRVNKHIVETRSISSLPTCLGELSDSLGVEEVDLGKVSVSLDVLALTLAGTASVTCENNDSSFKLGEGAIVMTSSCAPSFGDSSIIVSDNQSFVEQMGTSPTEEHQDIFLGHDDFLSSLPCHQSHAIQTTYDKIRWFLQNEVISSKLYNCPVTEETLETVISHIENFGPITNCKIEMIPLRFIYSLEQSMDKFSEELRRVYTPGYHLEKKGCLSFLVQSPEHLRRRHLSSLVPPLICGSRAAKREDDHKDETEDQLYAKSTLSSPDCPKSPKRLAQRVSFESDSDHILISEGLAVVSVDIDRRFSDNQDAFGRVSPTCEEDLVEKDLKLSPQFDAFPGIDAELPAESELFQSNRQDLYANKINAEPNIMKQVPLLQGCDIKMRHNSGHGGVQSDLSSLLESGLITEDECEADISDSNDSNDWLQDFEPPPVLLPDFWLILKSSSHFIHVYFHNRNESGLNQFMSIYLNIVNSVRGAVKLVNQRLLLQELCETKLCSDLLEAQLSDDLWRRDSLKDSESDAGRIAEAEMRFEIGTFSCPQAWKISFDLHPRVKSSVAKTGIAAINSLRTCLKPFSVVNRKNMFVYEDSSGVGTNVFYLRLHEYLDQPTSSLATPEIRRDDSLTSKSPLLMHAARRLVMDEEAQSSLSDLRPRLSSFGEKDVIVEGILSTPASRTNKDFIELCAHGVGSPGPAIKEELVQMLQKKLDDTVLDAICLMLFKNPHHKLSQEDVHFIQPPNQEPTKILRFALSPLVEPYFQAVTWYLRQNMLSSGFSLPKYADSKAEFHFQNFSESQMDKGAEPCIYLFVCNTKEGTKSTGIACIASSVCNVDYSNTLPFSKESPTESTAQLKLSDLESFLQIDEGDNITTSDRNMVLQFKIWESGRLDITELGKNIFDAIQHALWDFTMEYKILTIPPVPSNANEAMECQTEVKGSDNSKANLHAPSAVPPGLHNPIHTTLHPKSSQQLQINQTRRASVQVPLDPNAWSELQTKLFNKSSMKDRRSSEYLRSSHSSKGTKNLGQPIVTSPLGEEVDTVARLLNGTYTDVTIPWLEVAVSLNAPSVRKQIVKCPTKSCIPVIITELQSWSEAHLDEGNQIFHKLDGGEQFVEMKLMKKHLENLNSSDEQEELFIMNMSSDYSTRRSDLDLGELTFILTRSKKNKRFEPSLAALSEGNSTPCSPRPPLPHIVPRQICFICILRKKELTFYTYNWMKDLNDSLYSFFNQLTQWTSARARLLSSLALQKLGIFHNQPFIRKDCKESRDSKCSRKDDKREEKNAYVQSLNYVESLIKCPSPTRSVSLAADRASHRSQNQPTLKCLQQVYRNSSVPVLGIHKGDLLQLHGRQMAEVFRKTFMKEREQCMLETMMCAAETPTSLKDQWLHVLKKNSRIEHFCLTPLLFLPRWRRHIAIICDQFAVDSSGDGALSKPGNRSGHSSGSSNKANFPHTDLRRASSVGIAHRPSSPVQIRKRHVTMGDDKWYDALCLSYLKEYIQYLQSLGFVSVSIKHFNEKNKNQATKDHFMTTPTYLMKNVIGGTLLMHINFFEPFFSTTIYAIDSSRLNKSKENPTYQVFPPTCFIDDVDLYKVLLHMHSFTFDYHLRAVCDSVADRQLLFTSGYNFFSLLTEFMRYYSKSPSYARNLVYRGDIAIENTGSTDEQLYNYVLSKEKEYDMKVVRMNPIYTDHATDLNTEFALVQTKSCSFANGSEAMHPDVYEVTLVICHDLSSETLNNCLNLKFFIILTSKRYVYPNRGNDRSGRFRTVSTAPSRLRSSSATMSGDAIDIQAHIAEVVSLLSGESTDSVCSEESHSKTPTKNIARQRNYNSHVGIKQESVTYLGYFSPYEEFMQNILRQQAEQSEKRIQIIFNRAKIHCRRDSLWQKLSILEEKGKSVQNVSNLTHSELIELLRMVSVKPLSKFDPAVVPLSLKSMPWYQSFAKLLSSKYQEKCRLFAAPDGSIQYVVILNPPSFDICLMLTINHRSQKAKLDCVMKELECEHHELQFNDRVCSFFEGFINLACFHLWTTVIV